MDPFQCQRHEGRGSLGVLMGVKVPPAGLQGSSPAAAALQRSVLTQLLLFERAGLLQITEFNPANCEQATGFVPIYKVTP